MVWEAMPGLTRRPGIPRTLMWTQGSAGLSEWPCWQRLAFEVLGVSSWFTRPARRQSLQGGPTLQSRGAGGGTGGTSPAGSRTNGSEGSLERAGGGSRPLPAPQPHCCTSPRSPSGPHPSRVHAESRTQSQACRGKPVAPRKRGPLHGQRRRHDAAQVSPEPALACPPLLQVFASFPHAPRARGRESAHTPESLPTALCFSPHSSPPADHWALASGLPTYVAESGFVSPPALPTGLCAPALPT